MLMLWWWGGRGNKRDVASMSSHQTAGTSAERIASLALADMGDSEAAARIGGAIYAARNANMAARIADLLGKPGTSFVVVGAGHLVGKGSVIDLLEASGVRIDAVKE